MPDLKLGSKVKIKTQWGGCYDKKTGIVIEVLNFNFDPVDPPGEFTDPKFMNPMWYRVKFDKPAFNDTKPVESDVFLARELVEIK